MNLRADTDIAYRCRLWFGPVVMAVLLVGACSPDQEPTDYSIENRTGFLAACARPLDDPRLLNDVCSCAYDRIESEYRFDDFVELDAELTEARLAELDGVPLADGEGGLPPEVIDIVAECFVEEAGL